MSPPPRHDRRHAPDPCVAAYRTRHCRCVNGQGVTTVETGVRSAVEAGGSTHRPASGEAVPASLISWVTKVFTRPSPAATRLVGMRFCRRPAWCPGRGFSPLVTGGRGASTSCPDSTALQGDDFVLCARHVPRHTKAVCGRCVRCVCGAPHTHRALRLVQARGNGVCVLLSCHDGLAWGVHVAVRLPVSQSCCYLWEDSLCAGSLLGDLLLATSPGPCACSWSNTVQPFSGKIDHVSQAHG